MIILYVTYYMNIQNISTLPPYIGDFVNTNRDQLLMIYEEGMKDNETIGILKMVCSQADNKMDVQFSDENDIINNVLQKESWEGLKNTIKDDKKLFIINDLDKNSIFLLYI